MPKTIFQKIEDVQERAKTDPDFAAQVKDQAIAAIYQGFGKEAWDAYMRNFADTEKQLTRLTTTDGDGITYVRESRAYLVSNSVCFPGTTDGTKQGVHPNLEP